MRFSSSSRYAMGSAVEVGGQPGHEEGKFFGDVHPGEALLGDVGLTVGVGEDDLDDLACPAEMRGKNGQAGQRHVPFVRLGGGGVDRRVAHRQVVERSVLVGGTGVVRHLHYSIEELAGGL